MRIMQYQPGFVNVVDSKWVLITYRRRTRRPDGRNFKARKQTYSVYLQVLRLEIVVWYR